MRAGEPGRVERSVPLNMFITPMFITIAAGRAERSSAAICFM